MNATKPQRFVVYLIDFLVIGTITSIISKIVYLVLPIDTSQIVIYEEMLSQELTKFIQAAYGGMNYDLSRLKDIFIEILKYSLVDFAITAAIYLPVVIGYLVILPIIWDKQTLGRGLVKAKVVGIDGNKPSKKQIIIREVVGTYLFYCILGGPLIFVTILLIAIKGRSLVDYVSKTNLVSTIEMNNSSSNNNSFTDVEVKDANDDYVEAKFVDETNADNNQDEDEFKIV